MSIVKQYKDIKYLSGWGNILVTLLIESVMGSFWNSVFVSELENITDMAELCICVKKLEGWCVPVTGCFFNWYPPKKLKYGKPRLGESSAT